MNMQSNQTYVLTPDESKFNCTLWNNSCINTSEDEMKRSVIVIHYVFTVMVPICFAILIITGTFGNVLVMFVIITNKTMLTCTNIMLMNLAVADISFLVICVPFQAHKFVSSSWEFNDLTCKLVQYLLYVTCYVTIWTLVIIAIIRYFTVVWKTSMDTQKRNSKMVPRTICLCIMLWIANLCLHIPTLLSHSVKTGGTYYYCGITDWSLKPIIISFFIFAYALPLLIITLLYLRIIYYLKGVQLPSHRRHIVRTVRIISLVVVFFAISWLPYHIHALVLLKKAFQWDYYQLFRVVWYIMAYGNSVVNPVIYNFTSAEFRSAFQKALFKCCVRYRNRTFIGHDNRNQPETEAINEVQL